MGFFENLLQEVSLFARDSNIAFVILWLLLLVLIFFGFNVTAALFSANKIAGALGSIAFVLAYALYGYMASYGRAKLEVLNPGVIIIALAAFFVVFGCVKLLGMTLGLLF